MLKMLLKIPDLLTDVVHYVCGDLVFILDQIYVGGQNLFFFG